MKTMSKRADHTLSIIFVIFISSLFFKALKTTFTAFSLINFPLAIIWEKLLSYNQKQVSLDKGGLESGLPIQVNYYFVLLTSGGELNKCAGMQKWK